MSPRGGDLWCDVDNGGVTISGESVTFLKGDIEFPLEDEKQASKGQTLNTY